MMSGFCCEVAENCTVLGYYAASQFHSTVGPSTEYSPPPWARTAFFLFYLSLPFFLFHFHFYCCFVLPFPFIYYIAISSPFYSFTLFSLLPFMPFLSYWDTSSPVPLHLGLGLIDYTSLLNFIVTELFIVTTTLPSIQPLATNLLADTILLRFFTVLALPYINSVLGLHAFFWIIEP